MADAPPGRSFGFAFDPGLARWARPFGVLPTRSYVTLDHRGLEACFGPWRLSTPWTNVAALRRTGPYTAWRIAGPAHLSLADRGLTFAATTGGGVCVELRRPTRGIDPLGVIRHPAVTLGVDDLDGFVDLAEQFLILRPGDPSPDGPRHPRGHFVPAVRAALDWSRRDRSVDHDQGEIDEIEDTDPPSIPALEDGQHPADGSGPSYHRRYAVVVRDARRDLDDALAAIRADPNVLAETEFSPFTKIEGELGSMDVGDRYLVEIAGPWKGAVEVIHLDDRCVRMSTLDGHMEAGVIEFGFVEDGPGHVGLTIESWARSRDRALDLLYDKLGFARAIQSQMWVIACERFAELVGGTPDGPVDVTTERA